MTDNSIFLYASGSCPEAERSDSSSELKSRLEGVYDRLRVSGSRPEAAVSACLLGWPCRYDGRSKPDAATAAEFAAGRLVPVCPELQGGLPIPRPAAGIEGADGSEVLAGKGRVINRAALDVTDGFKAGAYEVLRVMQEFGLKRAILKQHSPSCGCGSFGGSDWCRHSGDGVACALLKEHGIEIESRGL